MASTDPAEAASSAPGTGEAGADFAAKARGVGYMVGAAMSISGANGIVQHMSHSMHVFEIAFFRQLIGALFLASLFLRSGMHHLRTQRFWLHAVRALLNIGALLTFFIGLSLEPIAKVVALSLTAPLFASLMAVVFLREAMPPHRWIALAVGFFGALVILDPSAPSLSLGAAMVLTSNALWAIALTIIKSLSRTESAITLSLYAAILMTPMAGLFAIFVWQTPTPGQLLWLVGTGVLGSVSQLCLGQAFREADATLVLPADFTKVVWASLIGYFAFGQVPEIWIWIGSLIVFGAVFYNAWSERRSRP